MSLKTINDSALICAKGSKTTLLKVTSQKYSKIKGVLIATEKDKEFTVNIFPFGQCGILRNSCKCKPTVWQKTLKSKINNNAKLSKDSFILCAIGGRIEFENSGVNNFSHSESSKLEAIDFITETNSEELENKNSMLVLILLLLIGIVILLGVLFYKLNIDASNTMNEKIGF